MRKPVVVALVGFLAQLIDGSLGMAYGVTSSTLLIATGTQRAAPGRFDAAESVEARTKNQDAWRSH